MAGKTREEIENRYRADMEVAEAYRADNPERWADLSGQAKDRRADALGELADESDRRSAAANLESARVRIQAEFPKAAGFPGAFAGNTEDEVRANAKAASDYITNREKEAADATRLASRGRVAQAWSPTGGAVVPSSEIGQEQGGAGAASAAAADRLAALRATAGTRAAQENPLAGDEMSTLRDLRASGRMRSTSDEAFAGGPKGGTGTLTDEDRKG